MSIWQCKTIRSVALRAILAVLCILAYTQNARAQYNAAVDVSKCYSSILQQSNVWQNNEDTHYHLLATMTKEDFDSLKANGTLLAFIPGLAVDSTWDVAKVQATKLVQTHDEELLTSRHTYSSVLKLDPQAESIFRTCAQNMVQQNPYGLFYYYTRTDRPDKAQLTIIWRWIKGTELSVKSSNIDNGYIAGTNPPQRSLFPSTWKDQFWPPTISEGQNFVIQSEDPNHDVNVTLVTSPEVRYYPIVIDHMPLRKKCVTTWATSNNDIPFSKTLNFVPEQHLTGSKKGGGDGFSYSESVDGVITDVTCNKLGAQFLELDLANGQSAGPGYGVGTNTATCAGWQNATPRIILMSYRWKKDHTDCEQEIPWPAGKR